MVEKKDKSDTQPIKTIKGLIKSVNSGDYFIISRTMKDGSSQEMQGYLASVQAPKMGSSNRVEEPFAFDAREFLRERIIGKKCEFQREYEYGGRDYGTLIVNGENMNLAIIKEGLAKVVEKKGNLPASRNYEDLMTAQQECKNKKRNIFSTDEKFIQKHTRNVSYFGEAGYNIAKVFEEAKDIDKPLEGIVEYVFSASYLSVYIHKFQVVAKVSLVHLFTPQKEIDKKIIEDGKAFTEKLLLHRTVGVKLERLEEGGNLYARIHHPAGDISAEVLKQGFSKLMQPKTTDFDANYYKTLKDAQLIAQSKGLRIWKDFKQEEKKQQKPSTGDFHGKVIEIHSGDSLTVERDGDFMPVKIYLATVKAPAIMKKPGEDPDPWAWESKEALRKATIGKKVRVVMEFSRTVKTANDQEKNMDFGSVFLEKNEKNVSTILLEKGLLKTNVTKSGDNASKFIEDLLAAEKKAMDGKQGVYSTGQAPIRVYNDIVANPKKAKDFEALVMKRPNRKMQGVIEYCFSGMRFKVRLDHENTAIAFNLLGVKTMANDKNQPQLLEFSNDALNFAKDTVFQRDVIVEPEFADKRGTFFGSVTLNNKNDFALMLVEEGLAQVSIIGSRAPPNVNQLEDAEKKVKSEGLGIWAKNVKLNLEGSVKQVTQNERTQVLMTDIRDANSFHLRFVNDKTYSKIESELAKFNPALAQDLEKPIKRGTLCAARFKVDDNWYRGKVQKPLGKGQYEVQFVDFGNYDVVDGGDLKRLPASLLQLEPQAKPATLAFIRSQKAGNTIGEEAAKFVQSKVLDKVADAIVVDQDQQGVKVVLFEKGEKDWNNSINCQLLEKGLSMMQQFEEEDELPEEINEWYEFEEEAKEKQIKIWQYGTTADDDDD